MKKRFIFNLINRLFSSKNTLYDNMDEYTKVKAEEAEHKYSFEWWLGIMLKLGGLFIIFILALLVFGCSSKVVTEFVPVHVPVACDMETPSRPLSTGDTVKDNLLIMKYAENLEANINKCKK